MESALESRDAASGEQSQAWLAALRSEGADRDRAIARLHDLLLRAAVQTGLTPHQRQVVVALALNEVPVDVLAERLGTNRNALYKTLHDARHKLRRTLADAGLSSVVG